MKYELTLGDNHFINNINSYLRYLLYSQVHFLKPPPFKLIKGLELKDSAYKGLLWSQYNFPIVGKIAFQPD